MNFLRNMFKTKSASADFHAETWQMGERAGDGTALGDAISQGLYLPEAGCEAIGHYDPEIAPFRVLPDGRAALLYDPEWDVAIEKIQAQQAKIRAEGGILYDQPIEENMLGRCAALANAIQHLLENEAIATFLAGTTINHFLFKYTSGAIWFSEEVASEIMLNSLANLLLKDPQFAHVHSIAEFEVEATTMLENRKHEMQSPF
ncbi:MAG: hypothetical protein L6Q49_05195 [Anaerolineales bacterium]|nr:hypothetical protein [Anaerolineales bacterium]